MQEEVERQKTALLERMKKSDMTDASGKTSFDEKRIDRHRFLDDRTSEFRGAQAAESKLAATKLKGAKAMRVERLLRKMEERARRRQKRKDEVKRDSRRRPGKATRFALVASGQR